MRTRSRLRDFCWMIVLILVLSSVAFSSTRVVSFNSNIVLFVILLFTNLSLAILNFKHGVTFFLILTFLNGFLNRASYYFSSVNFAFLYAYPQIALFGISVIALLRHVQYHGFKFRLRLLDKLILLYLVWSLFQALNPGQSIMVRLYGVRFRIVPVFFYFLVREYINNLRDITWLYKILLILTTVTIAYGAYQHLAGLPPIEFAWIRAFPEILAQKEATMGGGQGGWYNDGQFRVCSTFSGGNEFNYAMAFLALFFIGFNPLREGSKWKMLRLVAITSFFALITLTRERTPVGMVVAGLVVIAIFRFRPLARPMILIGSVALVVVGGLVIRANRPVVVEALGGDLAAVRMVELANPLQADTVVWRIEEVWFPAVRMIASNPLGYGLGATRYSRATRSGALIIKPHNTYLEVGLELGIIGLVLFAGIILEAIRLILAVRRTGLKDGRFYFLPETILAVLAAALACGMVSTVLLDTAGLLLWLMLSLIHIPSEWKHRNKY